MENTNTELPCIDMDKLTAKLEVIAQVVDGENLPNTARAVREIAAAMARSAITQQAKAPQAGAADSTVTTVADTTASASGDACDFCRAPLGKMHKDGCVYIGMVLQGRAPQAVQAGEAVDEPNAPEAPIHFDYAEASAWQSGWTSGYASRATLAPIASTGVSAPAPQVAAQQVAAKASDAHQSVNPAAQAVSAITKEDERLYHENAFAMYASDDLAATPASTPEASQQAAPFPERDQSKPAEQQGLFRKFDVRRVDGSDQPGGKHYGCSYYVLDLTHDQHAPAAMRAYAAACRTTHPQLADDIEAEFGAPVSHANPERAKWTTKQWYEHVGAWETPEGYISFGSVMALGAMLIQFQRTFAAAPATAVAATTSEDVRDAARLAEGYESGFFASSPQDGDGQFTLHYKTAAQAEAAYMLVTGIIDAAMRAAQGGTE